MQTIYTFNDKVLKNSVSGKWLIKKGLPPISFNTVRVRTNDGQAPVKGSQTSYETATLVPGTTDVWDVYKSGTSFKRLFSNSTNIIEVLEANTTGITDMSYMFNSCSSITTVPLFDTSNVTYMSYMFSGCSSITTIPLFNTSGVTDMRNMFYGCTSITTIPLFNTSSVTNMGSMFDGCTLLTSVPLFDTSNVTYMRYMFYCCTSLTSVPLFDTSSVTYMLAMFYGCTNVEAGALALYQQASTQTIPPSEHTSTFRNCGRDTVTGAAELAQIPSDWK